MCISFKGLYDTHIFINCLDPTGVKEIIKVFLESLSNNIVSLIIFPVCFVIACGILVIIEKIFRKEVKSNAFKKRII